MSYRVNLVKMLLYVLCSVMVITGIFMSADFADAASGSKGFSKKPSTKADRLIKTARSKTGRPYSYGSAGPNRFDCSGFVHWCVKRNGVKLVRGSAGSYRKKGYNIGRNIKKAKKGDIVIYGNGVHCALYVGDKKVIHATCRYGIKTTKYNYTAQPITQIIRTYTPAGNLKIKQKGSVKDGWKYKVTGRKCNGKKFVKYITTDKKGFAKIGDIKKGKVNIKNVDAPEGYELNKPKVVNIKHETSPNEFTTVRTNADRDVS